MSATNTPVTADDLRRWTGQSRIPGDPPDLTDDACLLIASGRLDPAGRALIVRRLSAGYPLPRLSHSYPDLRRLQHAILHIEYQLGSDYLPGVVAAVLRTRLSGMHRRREDARRTVVGGKGVFATGTRGIRRERRENLYLDVDDRERLFTALLATPVADLPAGGSARRAGSAEIDRVATLVGQVAGRGAARSVQEWADEALGAPSPGSAPKGGEAFLDGYETLTFLAGHFYDRIVGNSAWRSDFFEVQRTQVNLHGELADTAADIAALRGLRVDLDRVRASGGFDAALAEQIDRREQALRPVWSELIGRVEAFAEMAATVEAAGTELRILDEFDRTATIDSRIEDLLSRSGNRELSQDNTRRLSQQVRAGHEQLKIYRDVLSGNISRIAAAEPMRELPERYEPQ